MKKLLLGVFVITLLLTVSGCGKGTKEKDEKTGKEKTVYTCTKKDVKQHNNASNEDYDEDIKYVAKLSDEGKLLNYTMNFVYKYESQEQCEKTCNIKVKWNDDINSKNYSGTSRTTECRCDKKEVEETYEYDIPNLDKYLRSDIAQLKSDDSFDLDTWLNKFEKANYNCN